MLLFGFGYVYLFIPETRGLTLEEVCKFLFVISTREFHSCRSMNCIGRTLNLGTPLSGNHILVKKRIRTPSKVFIKKRIDMNVWSLVMSYSLGLVVQRSSTCNTYRRYQFNWKLYCQGKCTLIFL